MTAMREALGRNGSSRPEVKAKISAALKARRISPIGNMVKKWGRIDKISPPQQKLFDAVSAAWPEAELEYPMKLHRTVWLDVAIPSLKLDLEYDGKFHKWRGSHDSRRDTAMRLAGWKVIRIKKETLDQFINALAKDKNTVNYLP